MVGGVTTHPLDHPVQCPAFFSISSHPLHGASDAKCLLHPDILLLPVGAHSHGGHVRHFLRRLQPVPHWHGLSRSTKQYSACLVSRHSQLGTSPARYLQQEGRRGVVSLASMLSLIVASIWADWAFNWALNSYLLRATRARRLQCGVPRGSGAGVPPLRTLLELLCQGLLLGLQGTLLLGLQPSPLFPPLSLNCLAVPAPPNLLFRGVGGRGTLLCSLFIPG